MTPPPSVFAQSDRDTDRQLAKVGPKVITAKEFLERYELLPWPQRHRKNAADALKLEFLYALIAEKLLAAEALAQGLTREPAYQGKIRDIESKFVLDALYRQEVMEKVKVTDAELWEAYKKSKQQFFIKALQFKTAQEANFVRRLIQAGTPFESIAADTSIAVENEDTRNDTLTVVFGDYVTQVEDTLIKLKIGQVTSPLHVDDYYYIIKLERKVVDLLLTQGEFEQRKEHLEGILRRRKEHAQVEEFLHQFLAGTKGTVKGESLKAVALALHRVLSEAPSDSSHGKIWLTMESYGEVQRNLASRWSDSLLTVNDSTWSVGQFMKLLFASNFSVPDTSMRALRRAIDGMITLIIRHSYLTKEGYRRNLQYEPGVQEEMQLWQDNTLANLLKDRIRDTIVVLEDEMKEYYQRYKEELQSPLEINIREILLDDLQIVKEVMKKIEAGESFAELARKYSRRAWAAKNGGEFGYFPLGALGDIGVVAAKMKIGERYGPMQVAEGYSIFEVLGKRTPLKRDVPSFESRREQIHQTLLQAKQRRAVNKMLGQLAKKYDITINSELLKSLQVSSIPMMTYRFLGFGGRVIAVPFVDRLLDWVQEWNPEFVPLP